ncbi:MAG TPA: CBS domain-containing protein [Euryarchaeota archaeon]|nr:CBS domain-containing protein [Euryarchaeota archaeon]
MKVKELMTRDPVCVTLPNSRNAVIKSMVEHSLTGVPVLRAKDNHYVGVITRQHIFRKPTVDQLALLVDSNYPTLTPDQSVITAAKEMVEKNIHHIPVLKDGTVKGIVTAADLLKVISLSKDKRPVSHFIKTVCVPVHTSTPITIASEVVRLANVYAMPVLNNEGKLAGIVTDRDLFNLSQVKDSMKTSDLGLGDDENTWSWEGMRNVMTLYYEISKIHLPDIPVKEVMVANPMTVFAQTSISEAARTMVDNDFGQLPVTNVNDQLVGMLYELDAITALIGD